MTTRIRFLCLLCTALVFLLCPLRAAPAQKSLKDVLSAEEFVRAGLPKLTPEELAFLSQRLLQNGVAAGSDSSAPIASLPQGEAGFGHETKLGEDIVRIQRVPKRMTSSIPGTFMGWTGKTVFRLENGQVWQQVDGSSFDVSLTSPEVLIEKGLAGAFFLSIKGYGTRCKVKRLQ